MDARSLPLRAKRSHQSTRRVAAPGAFQQPDLDASVALELRRG
jgi:hypothetical protein